MKSESIFSIFYVLNRCRIDSDKISVSPPLTQTFTHSMAASSSSNASNWCFNDTSDEWSNIGPRFDFTFQHEIKYLAPPTIHIYSFRVQSSQSPDLVILCECGSVQISEFSLVPTVCPSNRTLWAFLIINNLRNA
jgi:hypothetical protein